MQALHRWRNFVLFNNSLIQSLASTSSSSHLASFHSTPTYFEKRKNNCNSEAKRGQPPPSKLGRITCFHESFIRFETRQKQADAKKALNKLLFNSGCYNPAGPSRFTFEEVYDEVDNSETSNKKSRSKSSAKRANKAHHKRKKRKLRREDQYDDLDEHPETMFQARFGNRSYTWSEKSWEDSYYHQKSTAGFEWRENQNTNTRKHNQWDNSCGTDNEVESSRFIGSYSQRTLLGLPIKGPIKLQDVKNAFRVTALKWHPDKHKGPSQAVAEEKFKHCVDAYKSLCNALSSA